MNFSSKIEARPDYGFLTVEIPANQTLKVEASSMACMDVNLRMKTKLRGGLGRFLSGESLFLNEFTAQGSAGKISIAPGTSGDLEEHQLSGHSKFYVTSSAYLASTMGVEINSKWQGLGKGIFSGQSFFIMECSGVGQLWFNCYGAMIQVDVVDEYIVDTGHIVAFTEGLQYTIDRFGGYKSLFFSGEGLVARFRGKGRIWIQTKKPFGFVAWADRFRRVKSND